MSRIYKFLAQKRGYTLVELLVYVSLVTLLLGVVVGTSISVTKSHRRSRAYLDINSAALSAFSRFSRDIRRANSIDAINSTFGVPEGRLVLNMKKDDGTNDVTTYYLSDAKVKLDVDGVYWGDITQGNMAVSSLTFRRFIVSSTTAIRVEMTVAPDASTTIPALNFYGTYVLRGSYVE